MTRLFALLAAILVSAIAVTSACAASGLEPIHFRIDAKRNSGDVAATFFSRGRNHNEWSTEFTASQLAGLNLAALRAGNEQHVRFAIVRDAGRLDCTGTGARSTASGDCDLRANPDFIDFLVSRGIQRPSDDQAFSMMSLDVRRETVDALHAAHYPVPTVEDLLSLTALGVDSRYIKGLAQVGYRPSDLDTLVQFKALDITPAYIQGFVRHGLANMPTDDLVQLKALGIDGDYVASFEQAGYRDLSADQLVQLKALGVTADYARSVRRGSAQLPTPDRLVELKALGFDPR